MDKLIKATGSTVDKYPYSIHLLKKDNPNTSFPKQLDDAQLAVFGVYPVAVDTKSAYDPLTASLVEGQPVYASGAWSIPWEIVDIFSDTEEGGVVTTKAEHEAAYAARVASDALSESESIRKREGVLFEGVMCSGNKEDLWGLNALKEYIAAGQSVPFYFQNGNMLIITPDNMAAFGAVWVPFRASFFPLPK